jgi:phage terminase large subunit-like protein
MKELTTLAHYTDLVGELDKLTGQTKINTCRHLCRTDLFFLLWVGCGRKDIGNQWLLDRCKEVEKNPDGYLDLWARGHYKSTIITFGKTIQDILASHGNDPLPVWEGIEPTFAIFSHTRPIAIKFLSQIKSELENNKFLKHLFPDVLYDNPSKEAPKWSEHGGIIVKRKSNPKEATVEAWGVVEGQPTGIHPTVLIYDDMVTIESVTSPNMIEKTMNSYRISLNLATEKSRKRLVGTFYDFNDPYKQMIKAGSVKTRIYPATKDGNVTGEGVFLSRNALDEKRRDMGPYVFSCQMLLNPVADDKQGFKKEWLRFYSSTDGSNLNKYILVDPAHEKKKDSDYTVIMCIGLGADNNYYLLDCVRDRLNLIERVDALFRMHRKWRPLAVGYESNGAKSDIHYIRERERQFNYHLNGFVELKHNIPKNDRIRRAVPSLTQGRWLFPNAIRATNYEGKEQELIDIFINEEYLAFPVAGHDDMLDCMGSIFDEELNVVWPQIEEEDKYDRYNTRRKSSSSSWAA